jgi:mannose-6-phosphate isomerase-like protein (cupin superfamily)
MTSDIAARATEATTTTTYSPSPRPVFSVPTKISAQSATRHIWGDDAAGQVADWIYASTDRLHCLVFGVSPGGGFRHSPEYRTIFGADEVLTVLTGRMVLANPATGEVQLVETGSSVAFSAGTWHHAFAHGDAELRVLELFAPPPSTGSSGAYARTQPYLETSRYSDDSIIGRWPSSGARASSFRPIEPRDVHYRLAGAALVGILSSTEQLTVATISVSPGGASSLQRRGGDELVFVRTGTMHIRSWFEGQTYVHELGPDDACFLPAGSSHEYRNFTGTTSTALIGVAPSFLEASGA